MSLSELKSKTGLALEQMAHLEQGFFVRVDAKDTVKTCLKLKENGFEFLTMLTAVCKESDYDVVYLLDNWKTKERVFVSAEVSSKNMKIPSLTPSWPAADWLEREVYDMFGISFEGHPRLERLITPDGFTGHPLQKEFTETN
jgi:NADH:ubiquinone oxidoreductase subunit C